MKTSLSHPIRIDAVRTGPAMGRIGLTFCPGKTQHSAMSGAWDRDLGIDLDAVRDWNASAVVSLIENHEFDALQVRSLGEQVHQRHMDWYHLPIRDVSVPTEAFERAWQTVGPQLRHRLRCGFDVLVHCKGGLGRAGMVTARLLVELGRDPADAIRQVRAARNGAIETAAQERYVMTRNEAIDPLPSTSQQSVRERAVGALLGLAVGDAVGTTLEFRARDSYPLQTGMTGGGPFRLAPGEWTDDTAMALALAESLYDSSDLDERDLMHRFVCWWREGQYSHNERCFDIGITTRRALSCFTSTGNPLAGSVDPGTAGNGSLMRLAPVAIRFHRDRARLKDVAARQSRTTHAAPEAVDACVVFAQMLADVIEGARLADVLSTPPAAREATIGRILAGSWRGKLRSEVRASGYVAHSLEAALWSCGRSGTYAQSVIAAANLGEDADTTAAIAGQLAGAAYSVKGIPAEWLDLLAWRDRIRVMAERLLED